jgi:2-polyprenyl-3-methyl-5-hydroxy-6-metoxy-1,4-benzoquinol methylase
VLFRSIRKFSEDVDLSAATALDIGCGDGRFTEYLIEQGAERVVAADANIHSLRSLAEHAEQEGYRENVVIVHADASLVPVLDETIDLVLSMGVLYYMNDRFEDGLSALVSKLRPGGQLIASEPDIEGVSLKALVFEGTDDFVKVFTDRRFVETHDSEPSKFRAFAKSEIRSLYEDAGLEVTGHQGLSLFPLLLAVRQARGEISDDETAATDTALRQAFDTLNESGGVHKHVIWNCRKVAETDA